MSIPPLLGNTVCYLACSVNLTNVSCPFFLWGLILLENIAFRDAEGERAACLPLSVFIGFTNHYMTVFVDS